MRKEILEKVFECAMTDKMAYVAVQVETEGNEKPELIINPYENYKDKLEYYRTAYDENLRLKSAAAAGKLIHITAAVTGDKLEEIEWQLCESVADWKMLICSAIDDAINNLLDEQEASGEARSNLKTVTEGIKEMFINERYTPAQKRFMCENIEEYRELFNICMSGTNKEFREKFTSLSARMNLC